MCFNLSAELTILTRTGSWRKSILNDQSAIMILTHALKKANKKLRNKVFYYDYNKTMKQEKDMKKAKLKKKKKNSMHFSTQIPHHFADKK